VEFIFVLRLLVYLRVREVPVVVVDHPSEVSQGLSRFWFLKIAEEIESLDEFFLGDFKFILLPLLLFFLVECVLSASTAHFLFQWCQIIDQFLQFAGLHFSL